MYALSTTLFEQTSREPVLAGRAYVRVAIERGIDRAGRLRDWDALTYLADPPIALGEHVTVPLGRGDTPTGGFVVEVGGPELAEGVPRRALKDVLVRSGAQIPVTLVELGRWLAGYYVCPLGMAMATLMPAAVKARIGARSVEELARVDPAPELKDLSPALAKAYQAVRELDGAEFPLSARALADAIGARTVREVNRLLALGALALVEREVVRARPETPTLAGSAEAAPERLTPAQHAAVEGIAGSLGEFSAHLLLGVTGSGKTEVYLRLLERALQAGRNAIVLVPEISLTPQASSRFTARFASAGVAVLHSGLTSAQRHREWKRAATGEARVVVGARSAVFAPLENVGVIVVDEEHDASYKQDQLPRYNARDVAVYRAKLEGCPVVLGSATPSLESWANAAGEGARYRLWRLPERVGSASMPRVEVVDMAGVRRLAAAKRPEEAEHLSPRLRSALRETLSRGEQAIILLNRRGYASYLGCASGKCGWGLGCEHCDAKLVLHTGRELPRGAVVRCHYCLAERSVPDKCPDCAGKLVRLGVGTQRVEEELARSFAPEEVGEACALVEGDTLVRVDSDTMRTGRDFALTLSRFARGEIRVLLGTQMIAKGHDFPNVSLVGVLCADAALALPDFRAAERTFQLVSQVAGRAGRGATQGLVVVQAFEPGAPAIRLAAAHRYEEFAASEMAARARSGLPPARRMARIVCRHEDFEKARAAAGELSGALREAGPALAVDVLGPSPCAISRIAGQFRFEVLVFAPTARRVQAALGELRARGMLKSDARTAIDVDPVALI